MDNNSLAILVILLLTLNLLFVGFYIVLVLKEVRTAFIKINKILDTVEEVTSEVSKPIVNVSGFISGVMQGLKIIKRFKHSHSVKEEENV